MKIAVVGAGWFGCSLAKHLLAQEHDVTIFERDVIFAAASGNNQDRVHMGFHYPRSHKTRMEISVCHDRFIAEYPTVRIPNNVYAVANNSLIDFHTYLTICGGAGLDYEIVNPKDYGLVSCEGAIRCEERVVDTAAVRKMFLDTLLPHVKHTEIQGVHQLGDRVGLRTPGAQYNFDAVINTTNLRLADAFLHVYHEAAMILEADGPVDHPSLTVMDGPFPTVLGTPTPGRFTISHVTTTALKKCNSYQEAQDVIDRTKWEDKVDEFVYHVSKFYPSFPALFTITGARSAVRTKPINGTDSRECLTHTAGRVMTIVCGKFASVFVAQERVDTWLRALSDTPDSLAAT